MCGFAAKSDWKLRNSSARLAYSLAQSMFRSTRGRPLQQDYYLSTTSPPALPQADGPRLEAFPQQKSPVEFVRILRASEFHAFNESDSTSGEPHAHVFEVSIASKKYALKIVRSWCSDPTTRFGTNSVHCSSFTSIILQENASN